MEFAIRLITGVLSGYMLLIFLRIIITWFGGSVSGRPFQMLISITDPYLNYFNKFSFLKFGMMDFSPIAGILLLVIALDILNTISSYGSITIGLILSIILTAVWSAVNFLITFFIILTLIRIITGLLNATTRSPIMTTLETILAPLTNMVYHKIFKNSNITYMTALAVTGGLLVVALIAGNTLMNYLTGFLAKLSV